MEKIVRRPRSSMPHDPVGRQISDRRLERAEFGLPASGLVFCCFNNSYKLTAVGLPELIARTSDQFESMAIELASKPERLASIRNKLAQNRLTQPLFNTELYTRHIEGAYAMMIERYRNGLRPDHIDVPP